MPTTPELARLQDELRLACDGDDRRLLALFDAARLTGLPVFLREVGAEFACLYRGQPATDLAHVAPYMVKLPLTSLVIPWLLVDTAAAEAVVFLVSDADPDEVRQHLRRFLMVLDPRGAENFFRFYDPRVLGPFLEASKPEEAAQFFGPIRRIFVCASVPPVKKPFFRGWTAPPLDQVPPPPAAVSKFALRPEHEERFAKDALARYEQRCIAYLRGQCTRQLANKSDEDVRGIITSAREIATQLGIIAGRDVTTLAEVIVLGPTSEARNELDASPVRERGKVLTRLRDQLRQQQSA
jgi:Domain of unknown function (DUF4123)